MLKKKPILLFHFDWSLRKIIFQKLTKQGAQASRLCFSELRSRKTATNCTLNGYFFISLTPCTLMCKKSWEIHYFNQSKKREKKISKFKTFGFPRWSFVNQIDIIIVTVFLHYKYFTTMKYHLPFCVQSKYQVRKFSGRIPYYYFCRMYFCLNKASSLLVFIRKID